MFEDLTNPLPANVRAIGCHPFLKPYPSPCFARHKTSTARRALPAIRQMTQLAPCDAVPLSISTLNHASRGMKRPALGKRFPSFASPPGCESHAFFLLKLLPQTEQSYLTQRTSPSSASRHLADPCGHKLEGNAVVLELHKFAAQCVHISVYLSFIASYLRS